MNATTNDQDFSVTFSVQQTPDEVFAAINDVKSWWTGDIEGRADERGAEFTYRYKDIHRTTHEVTELVPGRRVVWRVKSSALNFTRDPHEWDGTEIIFDIATKDGKTDVRFTHVGITPKVECYAACSKAWTHYVTSSLEKRIRTGQPQ